MDDDALPKPDTDVPVTFKEMAAAMRAITRPVDDPCRPLPFDPDDIDVLIPPKRRRRIPIKIVAIRKGTPLIHPDDFGTGDG